MTVGGDAASVAIEVHNTGPAIDPVRLKTLFDPLSGADRRGDDARLGLGLYIAQQIVLAHHGTIEVQSTCRSARSGGCVWALRSSASSPAVLSKTAVTSACI